MYARVLQRNKTKRICVWCVCVERKRVCIINIYYKELAHAIMNIDIFKICCRIQAFNWLSLTHIMEVNLLYSKFILKNTFAATFRLMFDETNGHCGLTRLTQNRRQFAFPSSYVPPQKGEFWVCVCNFALICNFRLTLRVWKNKSIIYIFTSNSILNI